MDQRTQLIRDIIIRTFPLLANDIHFKITSPQNPNYNCLAWALLYDDRWMQPPSITAPPLDGIVYWPENAMQGKHISCLVDAYEKKGFSVCDNADFEKEYQKIALYVNPQDGNWTHASRQLRNGFWTSKLGREYDIQHGTPYVIEGNAYGAVYCIMRRLFN